MLLAYGDECCTLCTVFQDEFDCMWCCVVAWISVCKGIVVFSGSSAVLCGVHILVMQGEFYLHGEEKPRKDRYQGVLCGAKSMSLTSAVLERFTTDIIIPIESKSTGQSFLCTQNLN